jgi:hypothetical protein
MANTFPAGAEREKKGNSLQTPKVHNKERKDTGNY